MTIQDPRLEILRHHFRNGIVAIRMDLAQIEKLAIQKAIPRPTLMKHIEKILDRLIDMEKTVDSLSRKFQAGD